MGTNPTATVSMTINGASYKYGPADPNFVNVGSNQITARYPLVDAGGMTSTYWVDVTFNRVSNQYSTSANLGQSSPIVGDQTSCGTVTYANIPPNMQSATPINVGYCPPSNTNNGDQNPFRGGADSFASKPVPIPFPKRGK